MHLDGKRFATDKKEEESASCSLRTPETDLFKARIQALLPRWDKCLNVDGNYVEV
jgi:hypothetical protein